jgi:hypothetical protein
VSFLNTIAAIASAISRPNMLQLPFAPMPWRTHVRRFLAGLGRLILDTAALVGDLLPKRSRLQCSASA